MSQSTGALKSVLAQHDVSAEPTHSGVVMRRSQIACGLVIALVGLYASVRASAKEIIDSPQAAIPSSGPRPVALAWPTTDGQHGVLDTPFTLGRAAGRTALETLNSQWEPSQKDGPDPKDANGYGRSIPRDSASRVCPDTVLPACLTFDNIVRSDGFGPLSVQTRAFVCYTARTNDGEARASSSS